ncbi:MAG: hypothetical protein PVI23_09315, partial [Maricaulaceae bacterium]
TIALTLDSAKELASKASAFYSQRMQLFPREDVFYEDVESQFIRDALQIEKGGIDRLFFNVTKEAREKTNDNTRYLYMYVVPGVFTLVIWALASILFFNPFDAIVRQGPLFDDVPLTLPGVNELLMGAGSIGIATLIIVFIYQFSYTHIQRENALSLDNFITTKFARVNNLFRVAQRESLQAEAQLTESQKDTLRELAASWALSYHWLSIRQLFLEFLVRNIMFQIRRNTALYYVGGVTLCLSSLIVLCLAIMAASGFREPFLSTWNIVAHIVVAGMIFTTLAFGFMMRGPFRIIVPVLRSREWNRFSTLGVGDAIVEQVTRDKMSIVLLRDRMRSGGG